MEEGEDFEKEDDNVSKMFLNVEANIKTDIDAYEEEKKPKVIGIIPKMEANPESSNAFLCPHEGRDEIGIFSWTVIGQLNQSWSFIG